MDIILIIGLLFILFLIERNSSLVKEREKLLSENYAKTVFNNRLQWDNAKLRQELRLTQIEFGVKAINKPKTKVIDNAHTM